MHWIFLVILWRAFSWTAFIFLGCALWLWLVSDPLSITQQTFLFSCGVYATFDSGKPFQSFKYLCYTTLSSRLKSKVERFSKNSIFEVGQLWMLWVCSIVSDFCTPPPSLVLVITSFSFKPAFFSKTFLFFFLKDKLKINNYVKFKMQKNKLFISKT